MTMLLVIVLVGIGVSGLTRVSANEKVCNVTDIRSPNYQLKRHLFCGYDSDVAPVIDPKREVALYIFLRLEFIEYYPWSSMLQYHIYLEAWWEDPRLTWDQDDYGGVDTIFVKNSEIWTPEVHALNTRYGSMEKIPHSNCRLVQYGTIRCTSAVQLTVMCDSDYTYWPHDRHNCTLQLGAWSHRGDRVKLFVQKFSVFTSDYKSNPQWEIAVTDERSVYTERRFLTSEVFPIISQPFSIRRAHPGLKSVIISPIILLTVVTMATLCLSPGSNERLILSCTNFLGHLLTLRAVKWHLPRTGNTQPNILLFYKDSLILSGMALILTCWLQRLTTCKRQIPPWLSTCIHGIIASKPGQLLLLNFLDPQPSAVLQENADDGGHLVNSEPTKSNWEFVVILIGWVSLFSFSITYFIMFCIYLPYPSGDNDPNTYF